MARRGRILRYFSYALLLAVAALGAFALHLDVRVRNEFEGRRFALPARIYARPLELHAGLRIPQADVEDELRDLGYRDVQRDNQAGWFQRKGNELEIAVRPFIFWDGAQPARRLRVAFADCRSPGSSRCRSAASIRRATRTGCWCAWRRYPSIWSMR
ncbi:MAG: hypothetical protein E6H57_03365 [Betaproteobacteria bacterium]|nr:MAG: hypothetical protein E6H57_03365 [Betaproteobacteria bacterium]